MTLLEITDLHKSFQTKHEKTEIIKGISLSIEPGQIVALLGPNGAGKTTTVQMIFGYLEPTRGEIRINDEVLTASNRQQFNIGLMLGGELGFYGNATAYDNLIFFAHLDKIPRRMIKSEVDRVLALVNLTDAKHQKTYTFSRGMLQRLHIARALIGQPQLLLLDEPTNGLDVEIGQEIRALIKHLAEEQHVGILLTSHLMSEVEQLADEILLLIDGKIPISGDVTTIIDRSHVKHIDRPATLEESYLALINEMKGAG